MRISLVAAMARNRVIGADNRLPWRLPADLKNFRRITLHHAVLMGRRTWESLGRPLPQRDNIVLTRDPCFRADGARVAGSLQEALERLDGEVMVIGGAEIFRQALPRAHRQYLSLIQEEFPGDCRYPEFDPAGWRPVHHEFHPVGPESPHPWSFLILDRKEASDAD